MKPRYRLFKRGNKFYKRDTLTNARSRLGTSCRKAAQKLVDAENQSHESPELSYQLAKAYLTSSDPLAKKRTWRGVMEEFSRKGVPQIQERMRRVPLSKAPSSGRNSEGRGVRRRAPRDRLAESFAAVAPATLEGSGEGGRLAAGWATAEEGPAGASGRGAVRG
jgi:hypothetical protein